MSKNEKIRSLIEKCRESVFGVDKEYWNGENANKENWEKRCNDPLVYDGLICDADEDCDILFLLKESTFSGYANYLNKYRNNSEWFPSERTWDFIQMTNDLVNCASKRIEKVWPDLCCWTSAYRGKKDTFRALDETYYKTDPKSATYNILKKVAIVNVKKTAGESSSEDALLDKAVDEYGELVKNEVCILNPDIILCGGTYKQAKLIWGENGKRSNRLECGAEYFTIENNGKTIKVVGFCHPSARVGKEVIFAYAKEVFKELKSIDGR